MAKKSTKPGAAAIADADVPVVGPREPCPCGSARRYKVCHGKAAARAHGALVRRPFEGVPGECDLVAMREVVPAATGTWVIGGDAPQQHHGREVTVATLLPMAWPALVRADGSVMVGLQVFGASSDVSRDLAEVVLRALDAEPGEQVLQAGLPGPGPRLQDILDTDQPFDVTVQDGFHFWIDGLAVEDDAEARASLATASESLVPTERLTSVEAAYWCRIGGREHLRWVLPHDEDAVIDAIARLHARGEDAFGEGSRYIGAFRAHGLAVPVWDVPSDSSAATLDAPVAALGDRLTAAMAITDPLTADERRARAGLVARQITLR
jgi:hypothetical protein